MSGEVSERRALPSEEVLKQGAGRESADAAVPVAIPGPYSKHLPALDGLRGLAILGVLTFHLFPGNLPGGVLGALGRVRALGESGVDLFFVLSGFLITGILYDSRGDSGYLHKFYARRALRIFPLYYGVLGVLFALSPWLHLQWRGMGWVLLGYLQNTDVNGPFYLFHLGRGLSVDHLWSLAVEEQFYLVWPVVVAAVPDRRRLLWIGAAVMAGAPCLRYALAMHGTDPNYIHRSTLCRADTLMAGAILALLLRGPREAAVLRGAKYGFFAVLAVSVGLVLAAVRGADQATGLQLLSGAGLNHALAYTALELLGWAVLDRGLASGSVAKRIFSRAGWRFFGRYSYGLYVLHFVALGLLLRVAKAAIAARTPNRAIAVFGAGTLSLLVALAAAYLSYQLFERQFLRLKRFFRYDGGVEETAGEAGRRNG